MHQCRWDADHLRSRFVQALSDMYRTEVPLYGDLVDIVHCIDDKTLLAQGQTADDLPVRHQAERHGAIRVGTEHELRMISRLFAIMGMHPVGYYDLEMVGFPLHGTAFRPTAEESLRKNPFRVFTTVLRPDLIASDVVRKAATDILSNRTLFSPRLCKLVEKAEGNEGREREKMTAGEADELIAEALKIFKWHSRSTVPMATYLGLKHEHPMVADIVCFPSAHINHLTPRTLDIDAVQAEMIRHGLPAKDRIEGPPRGRKCEILLRQTSFKALEEQVAFVDDSVSDSSGSDEPTSSVGGTHSARFGEVEQRGAAVTRKGRHLYDRLLATAAAATQGASGEENPPHLFDQVLAEAFSEFPDDWTTLRRQGLVYFRYRVVPDAYYYHANPVVPGDAARSQTLPVSMERLLDLGVVECEPITYEDFLPISAAGIFTSNLGDSENSPGRKHQRASRTDDSRAELEAVLGRPLPSEMDLYDELQSASVRECEMRLGVEKIVLAG